MTFLRVSKECSITPNYLEGVRSNLMLTRLDETEEYSARNKYVDVLVSAQTEYIIHYRVYFNCHTCGYPAYVTLKKLKLSNNNAVADIAEGLRELDDSEEMEEIHRYLVSQAIPRVSLNHTINVQDLMKCLLDDNEYTYGVNLRKKIDELCEKAIASAKSSSIGATLLAHKASRAKQKK